MKTWHGISEHQITYHIVKCRTEGSSLSQSIHEIKQKIKKCFIYFHTAMPKILDQSVISSNQSLHKLTITSIQLSIFHMDSPPTSQVHLSPIPSKRVPSIFKSAMNGIVGNILAKGESLVFLLYPFDTIKNMAKDTDGAFHQAVFQQRGRDSLIQRKLALIHGESDEIITYESQNEPKSQETKFIHGVWSVSCSLSNWLITLSPALPASPWFETLETAMDSNQSKNKTQGEAAWALSNTSLTLAQLSPNYIFNNSGPLIGIKLVLRSLSAALAKNVLPHSGGPENSTLFDGCISTFKKRNMREENRKT